MSKATLILNTGQMAIIEYDLNKIFTWENRYQKADYTNSDTYDPVTLLAGTVMGRISATNKIVPLTSGASDGSQYPVGILADNYTIEEGDTQELMYCNYGDVAESKILLQGSDDLETVIDGRTIRDRIMGDTAGVRIIVSREHTKSDNQ